LRTANIPTIRENKALGSFLPHDNFGQYEWGETGYLGQCNVGAPAILTKECKVSDT